jgi:hypothetical protein
MGKQGDRLPAKASTEAPAGTRAAPRHPRRGTRAAGGVGTRAAE